MKILISVLTLIGAALATPAFGDSYPVSGKWGESSGTDKGAIDCGGKRVIEFNGAQRTDSKGGVPGYRNRTVRPDGPSRYRVTDEFSTGQISNAHVDYTLRQVDKDRIEIRQSSGTVMLQRCR